MVMAAVRASSGVAEKAFTPDDLRRREDGADRRRVQKRRGGRHRRQREDHDEGDGGREHDAQAPPRESLEFFVHF